MSLFMAKVVNIFLPTGKSLSTNFLGQLNNRFKVGNTLRVAMLKFLDCDFFKRENGDIEVTMEEYCKRLKSINLSKSQRFSSNNAANEEVTHHYCFLIGNLLYAGQAALLQAIMAASKIQQRIGCFKVTNITQISSMLCKLLSLKPMILFCKPDTNRGLKLLSFPDAPHAEAQEINDQTRVISGLYNQVDNIVIYHSVQLTS